MHHFFNLVGKSNSGARAIMYYHSVAQATLREFVVVDSENCIMPVFSETPPGRCFVAISNFHDLNKFSMVTLFIFFVKFQVRYM